MPALPPPPPPTHTHTHHHTPPTPHPHMQASTCWSGRLCWCRRMAPWRHASRVGWVGCRGQAGQVAMQGGRHQAVPHSRDSTAWRAMPCACHSFRQLRWARCDSPLPSPPPPPLRHLQWRCRRAGARCWASGRRPSCCRTCRVTCTRGCSTPSSTAPRCRQGCLVLAASVCSLCGRGCPATEPAPLGVQTHRRAELNPPPGTAAAILRGTN